MLLLAYLIKKVFLLALEADDSEDDAAVVDEDLVPDEKFLRNILIVNHKEVLITFPLRVR